MLRRSESGGEWELPGVVVDTDTDEEPWEAASRAMTPLGYEAMGLRTVGEEGETEYWLMAGRSSTYLEPGDFYDPEDLPELSRAEEAQFIRGAKPTSG